MFNIFFSKKISKISELKLNIPLFKLKQIHSDRVIVLRNKNMIENIYEGDAIITHLKNIAIGVKTADCIPILIYDHKNNIIAAVHSGWRGTVKKILAKTIETMIAEYSCHKKNLVLFFGPSICKKCYTVKEDVFEVFNKEFKKIDYEKRNEYYHIDLIKINLDMITEYGIKKENIYLFDGCTSCKNDEYQSYRKNKNTEKFQISYIYMQ